jgi:hypothetical protein
MSRELARHERASMSKTLAPRASSKVLEVPLPIAAWSIEHAICVTPRLQHGEVHARSPRIFGHVIS